MSGALVADGAAAPVAAGHRPWRRMAIGAAGVVMVLALLNYGLNWVATGRYVETTDDAYVGGDVTDIAPQVSGVIVKIDVLDDQLVHKGDRLMEIDARGFAAALQKAQAEVAAREAGLANLDAMHGLQLSLIDEARADVAATRADEALARLNQSRYARLASAAAGSLQASQSADADLARTQAAVAKAQAALQAAQAQLPVIAAQMAEARAALKTAQADQTMAALNLGYTVLRAPFDGVAGNRSAHQGGYATAGAQVISLIPATGLWVDANFKEDQLARIRPGQVVSIVADVDPGQKITGHVQNLSPASGAVFSILPAENATGNFTKIVQRVPVRITLDRDAAALGLLRPGLSVTASINTK